MIQLALEGDDGYIKRTRSIIETLILSVGRHVLCINDIMEAADQVNPSDTETTSEEEKFRSIHLIQISDPVRYGNLNK